MFTKLEGLINRINIGVVKHLVQFSNSKLLENFDDIEDSADYVSHYFPHWMLRGFLEPEAVILEHPWIPEYYLDHNLIENVIGEDLFNICRGVISGENYCISFEDSYFLDCFLENYDEEEEYIIIHIDHHNDRGKIFAKFIEEEKKFELSSTGELVKSEISKKDLHTLRENGIIHQGNFLSYLSSCNNLIHVLFGTDELTTVPMTYSVSPKTEIDEVGFSITGYPLSTTLEHYQKFLWTEASRIYLHQMLSAAIKQHPNARIWVHIDLDEYDNPWNGNDINKNNIPCNTDDVLNQLSHDIEIISQFKPDYFHYCMPTGFFPSTHWIKCIELVRGLHD